MKNILKLTAVLGLAASFMCMNAATAAWQDDSGCNPCSTVCLSSPVYDFDVQFKALYLQSCGSSLQYAAEAQPLPLPSPNWKIHNVKPKYHFAFDVGAACVFSSSNSVLALNWTHFHGKNTASRVVDPSTNMIGPFFEIGPDASAFSIAHGKVDFQFDDIALNYGMCVNFGNCWKTGFFIGVDAARIKQKLTSVFSNSDETIVRSIKTPSSFTGVGPQIGMNLSYCICDGFSLTGEGSTSLLVGSLKNHTKYNTFSPTLIALGIIPTNEQETKVDSKTQLVPAFEGRLGLAYSTTFCEQFILRLEAGYEARIYINAIQSIDMGSEVDTPPFAPSITGVYARTFERNSSNFALAGPYITLDLGF